VGASYEQSVVDLIEACIAVENAAHKLYSVLAAVHSDDSEISALWMKMAREEQNHAAQFKLALGNAAAMVKTVAVDPEAAEKLRQEVLALADRYVASPPTVAEALTAAAGFEDALANIHMDRVASFADQSYKTLFKAMMAADKDHFGCLKKALWRRGIGR
jgi:rubrerythrin